MEIRDVPPGAVLVGAGDTWALLDHGPTDALAAALRDDLASADPAGRVRATLAAAGDQGGPRLLLISTGSRAPGADSPEAASERPATAGPPAPGIIDGIPADILAGRSTGTPATSAPTAPPASASHTAEPAADSDVRRAAADAAARGQTVIRRAPVTAAATSEEADHDGRTTHRGAPAEDGTPSDAGSPHLQHRTHETVLAVRCPAGHLTAAWTPTCRVCATPVPAQEPERLPRPVLGVLHLPTAEVVPLDRGVVLGRKPRPMPGAGEWPHLVHLPHDSTYLSREHLQIELDGWLVLARDLGSRGGTLLHAPGRHPERMRPEEQYALEDGAVLDLAEVYQVRFEIVTGSAPAVGGAT